MPRRRITLAIAGTAAALMLAAWQLPQWLDWTRYRTAIEVLAGATLGQPVSISGPISLSLLPQPVLSAAQVDIGGRGPSDLSIRVRALRLRIAFWPLIGGRVDARELVLRGPDLRIPWPAEPGRLFPRAPGWLAAFAARIEDGRLTIGPLAFSGINATLATLDTGALSASGAARFSGQDWHFTARLTAAGRDGAAGLDVTLDGQGAASGVGASFTGQLTHDGTLAGMIAGRSPDLAVLAPAPPMPFRAEGRLTVGSGAAAVDDVAMEIGGSPARGAMRLSVAPNRRLDLTMWSSRLDLDAWLPVLLRAGTTVAGIDVPIGMDFSAEAASLAGGTLEHVRAGFDLNGKDLVVRSAEALLPGNGRLRLSGRIARDDPARPRFEGDARAETPVLRTTARWLSTGAPGWLPRRLVAGLPDGVAQRAELSAHVVAADGDIALQHLVGTLDAVAITGGLRLKRGDPPSLTVDLAADRLVLDPWLPPHPVALADVSRAVSGLDADLRVNIQHAVSGGVTIDGLVVDAAVGAGVGAGAILARRIEGVARGARFSASGRFDGSGEVRDGRLSATTEDAARLAELFPAAWRPTPALWRGPARLDAQFAGPEQALAGRVRLALGEGELEAVPTVDLASGAWRARVAAHHPGARRLVAMLGLPERLGLPELPGWLDDGSLSLVARLAGAPGHVAATRFDLTAAALHLGGDLALEQSGPEPLVTGHIVADAVMLPLPSGDSNVPLPLGLLRGWQGNVHLGFGRLVVGAGPPLHDAAATVTVVNGALRLADFTAKLGSGGVTGILAIDATDDPPTLAMQAQVSNAVMTGAASEAPLDLLSGRADVAAEVHASGYSPSAILATLSGRVSLMVSDGTVSGFDLLSLKLSLEKPDPKSVAAAARDEMLTGATGFDRLEVGASVAHGDLVIDTGEMTAIAGEAHLSGGINLATRMMDATIALQPSLPNPPEVAIHLTGPIERPVVTPELAGLARWMAELVR